MMGVEEAYGKIMGVSEILNALSVEYYVWRCEPDYFLTPLRGVLSPYTHSVKLYTNFTTPRVTIYLLLERLLLYAGLLLFCNRQMYLNSEIRKGR